MANRRLASGVSQRMITDLAPRRTRRRRRRMRALERRLLLALVGAVALLVLLGNVVYGGSGGGREVVTVRPGDTVWGIVEAHYPEDADVRQRVDDVLSLNHLGEGTLVPGQALTLPPP
jgi:LysM domain